jgi:hypothetical protein
LDCSCCRPARYRVLDAIDFISHPREGERDDSNGREQDKDRRQADRKPNAFGLGIEEGHAPRFSRLGPRTMRLKTLTQDVYGDGLSPE